MAQVQIHILLALYICRHQILPGPGRNAEKLAKTHKGTLGPLELATANEQSFQKDLPGTAENDWLQLGQG